MELIFSWEVINAGTCAGDPGPLIDNTRGGGNFMMARAGKPGTEAMLNLPCVDFREQTTAGIFFSYHAFGNVGGSVAVDVLDETADPAEWVEIGRVTGSEQQSNSDPWQQVFLKMDQFAGRLLQIRFRAIKSGFTTNMSIDDVGFYLPKEQDAEMITVLGPIAGCDLNEESEISVRMRNFGTRDIERDSLFLFYQIDDQPPVKELAHYDTVYTDTIFINGNTLVNRVDTSVSWTDTILIDSVVTMVRVDSFYTHVFRTKADLSARDKTYTIKTWTALTTEENILNDTIPKFVVDNTTNGVGYLEDFETFRDALPGAPLGQVTDNGWTVPSGLNGYTWHVQTTSSRINTIAATPTMGTGPRWDRTTGKGQFMYVDSGDNDFDAGESELRGTALFQSSCIDLRDRTSANMSFWYHRYGGRVGQLFVDVLDTTIVDTTYKIGGTTIDTFVIGKAWKQMFNIKGQRQAAPKDLWKQAIVPLDSFAGSQVRLRFRARDNASPEPLDETGIFGDIAIDDILIYEPSSHDVAIVSIPSPGITDGCNVGGNTPVTVVLQNSGTSVIFPGEVTLAYDYAGLTIRDTLREQLDVGQRLWFTFSDSVDLSLFNGTTVLEVTAELDGDTLVDNNRILRQVNNRKPGLPRYFIDFEDHTAFDWQGWRESVTSRPVMETTYRWHVQCGPGPWVDGMIPVPPPGPPSGPSGDHTFSNTFENGEGCYVLTESNWPFMPIDVPDAFLELPCGGVDFSNSQNNKILISFWHHFYGENMGDLFVDVHDGERWHNRVENLRGFEESESYTFETGRWKEKQITLDQFAGLSNVRIRFRAEADGRSGEIGVDDVEILDRIKKDGRMIRIMDPESDCNLTNTEQFRVEYQNLGTEDILESILAYQITFTPFTNDSGFKVQPVVGPIVRDTAVGPEGFVAPLAKQTFSFDRLDMTEPGKYEIKVWTEVKGDFYFFNDTIVETILNETRPFPWCEDFSDFTLGDQPKVFREGKLPNAWVGNESGYMFRAGIDIASAAGAGHTDADRIQRDADSRNDMYIFAPDETGLPPRSVQATITSPCFDLTNTPAAILEFWYKAPSAVHQILVQAGSANGGFTTVDTLERGFGVFSWTKATVVVTDFVGDFTQIRFLVANDGAYVAIDDVCLIRPKPQQIELERIVSPAQGLCYYSDQEMVALQVANEGLDRIDSFKIVLAMDKDVQNFPLGLTFRDTMNFVVNGPPFLDPGEEMTVFMDLPEFLQDMSETETNYFLNVFILLPGDVNLDNNKVEDYIVFNPEPIEMPYVEDFELIKNQGNQQVYTNGIQNFGGNYFWREYNGDMDPFDEFTTGPAFDHTKGTKEGSHMTTWGDGGRPGDPAFFITRCIDISKAIDPQLKYWYHMFGFDMGDLFVQVNDDNGWVTVDSRRTSIQADNFDDWDSRQIPLSQFEGNEIRLRFVSFRGDGPFTNMAVDDISVFDLAAIDIAPVGLADPIDDTTYCYSKDQKVSVVLRNNGSDSLTFPQDSTIIKVTIFKEGQLDSQLVDTIFANIWMDLNDNNALKPIPRDSTAIFTLRQTFDMSDTGKDYRFIIEALTKGDEVNRNDEFSATIRSQRIGGRVARATPKIICSGDEVRLTAEGYYGALRWEEKRLESNGPSFWGNAAGFPVDERHFLGLPDTTTWYRIRICNSNIISDSLKVDVIKPYPPRGIHDTVCGPLEDGSLVRPPRMGINVASNIDQYRVYDSLENGNVLIGRTDVNNNPTIVPNVGLPPILRTDTFFVESIIESDAPEIEDGFCVSLTRSPIITRLNSIPRPKIIDFTKLFECVPDSFKGTTSCYRLDNSRADTVLSVCQDSSFILDAGREEGRNDNYSWTVINPDGSIVTADDSSLLRSQTLVIDAWRLEPNNTYGYTVFVESEAGCRSDMGPNLTTYPQDTLWVEISDSCVTSIAKVSF